MMPSVTSRVVAQGNCRGEELMVLHRGWHDFMCTRVDSLAAGIVAVVVRECKQNIVQLRAICIKIRYNKCSGTTTGVPSVVDSRRSTQPENVLAPPRKDICLPDTILTS